MFLYLYDHWSIFSINPFTGRRGADTLLHRSPRTLQVRDQGSLDNILTIFHI